MLTFNQIDKRMTALVPASIDTQVRQALIVLEDHLGDQIEAIHLFGSAVDGGLQVYSDIDLLVTVSTVLPDKVRNALMTQLLAVSAPIGAGTQVRPLEVTVIAKDQVIPWQYPARRELQFGEWLREDLEIGIFEPPSYDHDLAILLSKVRRHSVCLFGQSAESMFASIPARDFQRALRDTLDLWHTEDDIRGDEWHIVLALARIWFSAETGEIAPKDVAAKWALERAPTKHRPVIETALATYYGLKPSGWEHRIPAVLELVRHVKSTTLAA